MRRRRSGRVGLRPARPLPSLARTNRHFVRDLCIMRGLYSLQQPTFRTLTSNHWFSYSHFKSSAALAFLGLAGRAGLGRGRAWNNDKTYCFDLLLLPLSLVSLLLLLQLLQLLLFLLLVLLLLLWILILLLLLLLFSFCSLASRRWGQDGQTTKHTTTTIQLAKPAHNDNDTASEVMETTKLRTRRTRCGWRARAARRRRLPRPSANLCIVYHIIVWYSMV